MALLGLTFLFHFLDSENNSIRWSLFPSYLLFTERREKHLVLVGMPVPLGHLCGVGTSLAFRLSRSIGLLNRARGSVKVLKIW